MAVSVVRKKSAISSTTGYAGLRILTQISHLDSRILLKSGLKPSSSSSSCHVYDDKHVHNNSSNNNNSDGVYGLFLRSCHLCNKTLHPDKDVYMYRGDQGYCSLECRSRQIIVDEAKEMKINNNNKYNMINKKRLGNNSSASPHFDCQGCETCQLLKELRQQRQRRRNNYNNAAFSPSKHRGPLFSIFS